MSATIYKEALGVAVEATDTKKLWQMLQRIAEAAWHAGWQGQVAVVESVDDAVALLNGVE